MDELEEVGATGDGSFEVGETPGIVTTVTRRMSRPTKDKSETTNS